MATWHQTDKDAHIWRAWHRFGLSFRLVSVLLGRSNMLLPGFGTTINMRNRLGQTCFGHYDQNERGRADHVQNSQEWTRAQMGRVAATGTLNGSAPSIRMPCASNESNPPDQSGVGAFLISMVPFASPFPRNVLRVRVSWFDWAG